MLNRKLIKIIYVSTIIAIVPFCTAFGATGEIDGNAVRMRKEPSTSAKIITLLEKGKKVEVLEKEEDWYKVKSGKNIGWVSDDLIKNITDTIDTKSVAGEKKIQPVAKEESSISESEPVILAVTGSAVNLRKEPSTKSEIVGKVVEGDNLISSGKTDDNEWYKIKFGDIEGYVYKELVTEDINEITGSGKINDGVNFRKGPSTESEIISKLSADAEITILDAKSDWYKILYKEQEGWVVARCVDTVTSTSRSGTNSVAKKIIELAKQQLGKKYVWGANGPSSFDCSGLTKYIYGKVGVTLNRVSYDQATQGIKVEKSKLQAGDLVFFSGINASASSKKVSHVGIYIGSGYFIHASNPTRGVVKDELSDEYYSKHYVTARRVIR